MTVCRLPPDHCPLMGALCVEACTALGAWGELFGVAALAFAAWQRRQRNVAVVEKKVAVVERDAAVQQLSMRPTPPAVVHVSMPPFDFTKPFPPPSDVPTDTGQVSDP